MARRRLGPNDVQADPLWSSMTERHGPACAGRALNEAAPAAAADPGNDFYFDAENTWPMIGVTSYGIEVDT